MLQLLDPCVMERRQFEGQRSTNNWIVRGVMAPYAVIKSWNLTIDVDQSANCEVTLCDFGLDSTIKCAYNRITALFTLFQGRFGSIMLLPIVKHVMQRLFSCTDFFCYHTPFYKHLHSFERRSCCSCALVHDISYFAELSLGYWNPSLKRVGFISFVKCKHSENVHVTSISFRMMDFWHYARGCETAQ